MKNSYILKVFALSQIVLVSLTLLANRSTHHANHAVAYDAQQIVTKLPKVQKLVEKPAHTDVPHFNSESDLVRHAIKNMKKEVKKRSGSPYSVSSVYKMTNDNVPASVSTKIYYSDYHKTPESIHTDFNVQQSSNIKRVVEVVYKFNQKEQVALVDWDPKKQKRRLGSRHVKISNIIS